MLTLAAGWVYVSIMIVLANVEQLQGQRQPLSTALRYGLAGVIFVWMAAALLFTFASPENGSAAELARQTEGMKRQAAIGFVLAAAVFMLSLSGSKLPWTWIEGMIVRLSLNEQPRFHRYRPVHQLAVMLMVFQTVAVLWRLVMAGGLEGLDFAYANPADALINLAMGAAIYGTAALLGVGWLVRRNFRAVLKRLGLRFPKRRDWVAGIAMALALHLIVWGATAAWASLVTPSALEQQTRPAQQLFDSFNSSLILGALLALLTAVSEEILFRGALQPIFGLALSSLFFTTLHIQYAFTPAVLIVFIVSLGFGLLRNYVSTTASIIAHSIYNFAPFFVFALLTKASLTS